MKNSYVAFLESGCVIDCGALVDWAARDVTKALRASRPEALHTLELLRSAEQWWCAPKKIRRRKPRGIETPFTSARCKLEAALLAKGVTLPLWRTVLSATAQCHEVDDVKGRRRGRGHYA
jgi:hypothetical protein